MIRKCKPKYQLQLLKLHWGKREKEGKEKKKKHGLGMEECKASLHLSYMIKNKPFFLLNSIITIPSSNFEHPTKPNIADHPTTFTLHTTLSCQMQCDFLNHVYLSTYDSLNHPWHKTEISSCLKIMSLCWNIVIIQPHISR